jgi:hypothetical protein
MRTHQLLSLALFLCVAPLACGQLESNTITVTATRTLNVAPDQVVFSLSLTTPITMDLDQAVAALASLGITAADLQSASTPSPYTSVGSGVTLPGGSLPGPQVVWSFTWRCRSRASRRRSMR